MMEGLQFIFRWLHVFVGIIWIGHLYFFNFVNAPLAAQLDGPTKQKVVPELMPRALFWFRWGRRVDLDHRVPADAARLLPRPPGDRRRRQLGSGSPSR